MEHDELNTEGYDLDSAAAVFEGLLSRGEETQDRETHEEPDEREEHEREDSESPEPEEQEDDESERSDEESEEQEEEEKPAPEPRKIRVKKGDVDEEVTEEELINGYLRTSDYTRKTQALAEQRKAHEAESKAVREERARYANYLTQLEQAIQANTPKEPDWDRLRVERPDQYAATWAAWQQHKERQQALADEAKKARDAVVNDQRTQFAQYLQGEREQLLEKLPTWKDAAVAKQERTELVEYAKAHGYTEQDLAQVYDHRALLMLRKAMLFDRAEKAKAAAQKKIEKGKAKALEPGSSTKRKPVSDITRAKQRLAQTGSVRDAALVFEQLD